MDNWYKPNELILSFNPRTIPDSYSQFKRMFKTQLLYLSDAMQRATEACVSFQS